MGILELKHSKVFLTLGLLALANPSLYAAPAMLAAPVSPVSPSQRVGIVAAVHGSVKITQSGQAGKIVESGQPVFLGDTVSTDGKGSLQILLLDQTVFTIGPNSSLVIDQFVYDPSTHEGVVKAKVVKGVFRFVTGKIGQKKPQQMEVDLPSGTIGIRGTIVAGEVEGKRSKVILLGPGEKNNTGHREGKFILSNQSDGRLREETVSKTGFGSIIEGEGSAPTKPFQVPEAELARITTVLGPLPPADSPAGNNQSGEAEQENRQGSPTEQSGQAKVKAEESANQARAVGRVVQRLNFESNQTAQRVINSFLEIKDGPTSRNQLQAAAQKLSGTSHFERKGVLLTGPLGGAGSEANFYVDINFSNRTIGGGNSRVDGNVQAGQTFQYDLNLVRPFGTGDGNASFSYPSVSLNNGASTCVANCNSANIDIGINNSGGNIASNANVNITIFDTGGNVKASAATVADRLGGASTT